jgi:2-iminobutanoate/2-iminopropanoate deaminase
VATETSWRWLRRPPRGLSDTFGLLHPLLTTEVVPVPRKPLSSATASAIGPYSHAIDDGTHVFCSGQTPIDPATGRLREGSVGDQTNQCFDNLFAVLAAGGLTSDDVVKVNVYLTDMADFEAMNAAYVTRFSAPPPARTTIGVAALPMAARVEIELVAKKA